MAILNIGICIFLVICNLKKRENKVKKLTETRGGGEVHGFRATIFVTNSDFPERNAMAMVL